MVVVECKDSLYLFLENKFMSYFQKEIVIIRKVEKENRDIFKLYSQATVVQITVGSNYTTLQHYLNSDILLHTLITMVLELIIFYTIIITGVLITN